MPTLANIAARVVVAKAIVDGLRSRNRARRPVGDSVSEGPGAPVLEERRDGTSPPSREGIPPQHKGGPGPDTPLDLPPPVWMATLKRTLFEVKKDRIPFAAAAMAYYFFLALVPSVIAAIGIMGLLNADTSGVVASIRETLPGKSGAALADAFRRADDPSEATSLTSAVLGIGLALWSASSGMVGLQSGLNVAYDVEHDRKFIGKRAVALVLIVATLLLGGVPSPFFTFGEAPVYVVLAWVLTIAAVMLLFSIYYYLAPNRDSPHWQWVTAGGILGAALWVIACVAFGVYVEVYSNYSKTYGSLGGVVVLLLLLFLTSLAVLIGGELNAELERQSQHRTEQEEKRV